MAIYTDIELEYLGDFRNRMANSLLVAFVWLGLFGLAASLVRIYEVGWQHLMALQTGVYVYLVVLALLRKRLPYEIRAYSVVAALFLLGVGGLLTWGMIGYGGYLLSLSLVLALLLFGGAAGVWVFVATLAVIAILGTAVSLGMWTFDFDIARYAVSPTSWIGKFLAAIAFYGLILLGLSRVQDVLTRLFASLLESNEMLRKEAAERRRAEEHAIKLLGENRALTRRLYHVQEEERKHLARELHDEAGQWLMATKLYAHSLTGLGENKETAIDKCAEQIIESVAKAHSAIGNIIRDLRPGALDELGLADSLRELAGQWRQLHPEVSLELELEGGLDDLGDTLNITIYRIIQECLTNAAKYAEASRISVRIGREAGSDELLLSVGDDGKGMDPARIGEGFGLRGMRERVAAVGGELTVSAQPGEGVHVEARLPAKLPVNGF